MTEREVKRFKNKAPKWLYLKSKGKVWRIPILGLFTIPVVPSPQPSNFYAWLNDDRSLEIRGSVRSIAKITYRKEKP